MFKETKMTNLKNIALSAAVIAAMTGCGDTTVNQSPSSVTITGDTIGDTTTGITPDAGDDTTQVTGCPVPTSTKTLPLDITVDTDLTADTLWLLSGLVVVKDGATLTIDPCTTIAGMSGTADATSYMIVDKGAQIIADGTEEEPIVFTSAEVALNGGSPEEGQWGGITIIGHAGNDQTTAPYEVNSDFVSDDTNLADNSGVLRHVKIFNSGITMAEDKEINGLSLIGVGSGTTIEDITVDLSDDDGIEIWGGTVNLTNVTITRCTDDYFDIDDGYSGTVKNLVINTTIGNAGIEMSGDTAATFDGFSITTGATQAKEGAIFFKKDGIGGHFKNGTIIHNGGQLQADGAIHSQQEADIANVSFENISITAPNDLQFTDYWDSVNSVYDGTSAELKAVYIADSSNTLSN